MVGWCETWGHLMSHAQDSVNLGDTKEVTWPAEVFWLVWNLSWLQKPTPSSRNREGHWKFRILTKQPLTKFCLPVTGYPIFSQAHSRTPTKTKVQFNNFTRVLRTPQWNHSTRVSSRRTVWSMTPVVPCSAMAYPLPNPHQTLCNFCSFTLSMCDPSD